MVGERGQFELAAHVPDADCCQITFVTQKDNAAQWMPDDLLWFARVLAVGICTYESTVTIDDVRILYDKILGPYWKPGNWMGSIFKDKRFEPTGGMVSARHKKAHGRLVREWRLRPVAR
jgi:hypothetical protein